MSQVHITQDILGGSYLPQPGMPYKGHPPHIHTILEHRALRKCLAKITNLIAVVCFGHFASYTMSNDGER